MTAIDQHLARALGPGYQLDRELGGGGMSRVFLARDLTLDRPVVVKVHPQEVQGLAGDRFRREIQVAAQLQHPNLVPVLAAGEADGLLYFLMPYVEGESLRTLLERDGALPPERARVILRDVGRALAFAHDRGIVHRDIKPDNVLLAGDAAMVTDFGVAKALSSARTSSASLTAVGMSLGTPSYIAPEQAAGDANVDHRADLYAWGCVAYELLTGQPPFAGKTAQQLIVAHLTELPAPLGPRCPDAPRRLVDLVMRCLEKDPARRPQSARELVEALDRVDDPLPAVRPGRIAAVAVVGAALLAVGGWLLLRDRPAPPPASGGKVTALAVLPLATVGGGDPYLAEGMTEELITALSRVPGLRVASRTSVYALPGRDRLDVREIARRLAVAAVLEGSVRQAGGQLRLTARLTSAADGLTLWSESYQRAGGDLFAVQDELARSIAGALALRLDGAPAPNRGTDDLAAYDLYLRGRHRWRQRGEEPLREAVALFGQAIARDSGFARAWAGLGDALSLLPLYGRTPLDSVLDPARAAATRAITLDSTLAAGYATLGNLSKSAGAWPVAVTLLEQAIALDSTDLNALQWLGEAQYQVGRLEVAAATLARAGRLDSSAAIVAAQEAHVLALLGRDPEAMAAADRAIRLAPELSAIYLFVGSAHLAAGRRERAAEAFDRAASLATGFLPAPALACLARGGRGCPDPASLGGSPTAAAVVALARGDRPLAIRELERAVRERDAFLFASSLTAPWWRPLRDEPAFLALARRMGVTLPAR